MPSKIADYPPLAQQYYFKDIKPIVKDELNGCWGAKVKSLLKGLCRGKDLTVEAEIDSEKNALIYLDNEVRNIV